MPELWMPGAEQLDLGDHAPCDPAYPPKAIAHITWDKNATAAAPADLISFETLRSYFSGTGAGMAPHILWDPWTGRYVQFYPATSRSKSVVDQPGLTRTNRAGAVVIQIEALFFPYCRVNGVVYPRLVDTPCTGWPELHAWVKSWGVPDAWPGGRPESCTRDEHTWETQGGWYPHAAVPENDHTDPLTWPAFPTGGSVTSIPGVDYAWSHPGGAALKAAGKQFACRYLSPDSSKNITRAEADDLAAHGVWSVVVWESTADRAKAGRAAGVADATTAAKQAAMAGMPSGRPIYFAVDFDAAPGDQTYINAYLDGAASVIGVDRVGIYGGYYPVKRALDAGKAKWAWQTSGWSGGQWDPRAVMRQGAQLTIGGVSCDLNTALADDYGQWMPGKTPKPEADMPITDADAQKIALATWSYSHGDNPDIHQTVATAAVQATASAAGTRALVAKLDAQGQVIDKLVTAVATLTAGVSDLDPETLAAELKAEIAAIRVNVSVSSDPTPPTA
jgi:hypothetical protein